MPTGTERRYVPLAEFRADQSGEDFRPVIRGYPIIFGRRSEDLGGFVEIVRPEALERTLREKIDLRALKNHNTDQVLGRLSSGTLRVKIDATGLRTEIDPPNTGYARDLIESMRRGDVTGGSFAFHTLTDYWRMEDGIPVRELLDIRVSEVSVGVTFPAYSETDVDVARRALQAFEQQVPRRSIIILSEQLAAKSARWK